MQEPRKDLPASPSKRSALSQSLTPWILAGLVLGVCTGFLLGPSAAPLGEIGKLVIQLVRTMATPLLFLAIIDAILKTEIKKRDFGYLAALTTFNGVLALSIGLMISNLFQPGRHFQTLGLAPATDPILKLDQKIDIMKTLASYIPTSIVEPFSTNAIIPIVLMAILIGAGLRRVRAHQRSVGEGHFEVIESAVKTLLNLTEQILTWVIRLVPLAVFGVSARAAGQYGIEPLKGLAAYVGCGILGITLFILIVHQGWVVLVVKMKLADFWRAVKDPTAYAFGANSSMATLPVTLKTLDKLKVSRPASTLAACIGTNLNNDGIILYEAMAVLAVAQASGIDLSLSQQIMAAAFCLVAAMGVAGVPEAGFVSLSLVLTSVGLPTELLPLLLTVDWIVARMRSVANVLSDIVNSMVLDRVMGKRKFKVKQR